jgi:hypothetical protein
MQIGAWMVGLLTIAFAFPTLPAHGATFVVNAATDGSDVSDEFLSPCGTDLRIRLTPGLQ